MKFVIILLCAALSGCITIYDGEELEAPLAVTPTKSLGFLPPTMRQSQESPGPKISNDPKSKEERYEALRGVLENTHAFKSVEQVAMPGSTDLTLSWDIVVTPGDDENVWPFISCLTLFLVPYRLQFGFTSNFTLKDQSGSPIRTYSYEASQTVWLQTFLLFAMPFWDNEAAGNKLTDNHVTHLITDLRKDGLL